MKYVFNALTGKFDRVTNLTGGTANEVLLGNGTLLKFAGSDILESAPIVELDWESGSLSILTMTQATEFVFKNKGEYPKLLLLKGEFAYTLPVGEIALKSDEYDGSNWNLIQFEPISDTEYLTIVINQNV